MQKDLSTVDQLLMQVSDTLATLKTITPVQKLSARKLSQQAHKLREDIKRLLSSHND